VSKLRVHRPSPALVIACVALLVALGGTGYATGLVVPRNSVGTKQLTRNAVTSSKLAPNAVQTAHVLNGSLLTEDFKPGQIPKGEKGDKGDRGDTGPPGPTWGEVKGSSTGGGTYQPISEAVALPNDVGKRGSDLKFLVFGSVSLSLLRCTSAGACGVSYVLLVNNTIVPTTGLSFSGPAGQTTSNQHGSAFGVVTVKSVGPGGTPSASVRWGLRSGTNVASTSTAAHVGAVRLGS
jgi:hypothetical protein